MEIPVVEQYKFLGIIFDKKLSFIPHINYLKVKCHKALQLLRVVAHTDWGADKSTVLKLYRSLVRSKLDYGCFIYGSARKSYLRCLDSIHHLGLRLALGALRTSPVNILQNFNPAHPTLHLNALFFQNIKNVLQEKNQPFPLLVLGSNHYWMIVTLKITTFMRP